MYSFFLLVCCVVLLIDHDEAQTGKRRKHGRAHTDHDCSLAPCDPSPFRPALTCHSGAVQHSHPCPEPLPHVRDQLMGEGNFRHEDQDTATMINRCLRRLQVHCGFAASRNPMQEEDLKD